MLVDIHKCDKSSSCKHKINGECVHHLMVFKFKDYALELVRSLKAFYRLVAVADMRADDLEALIDRIRKILNKPIKSKNKETLNNLESIIASRTDKIGRFSAKILPMYKYFEKLIDSKSFYDFKGHKLVKLKGKDPSTIFFLSSSPARIIAAFKQDYLVIPVSSLDNLNDPNL